MSIAHDPHESDRPAVSEDAAARITSPDNGIEGDTLGSESEDIANTSLDGEDIHVADEPRNPWRKRGIVAASVLGGCVVLGVLGLGAFPVGMLRETVEERLSKALDAPVTVTSLSRDSVFSFSPRVTAHTIRIGQPQWAGTGDMLNVSEVSATVPVLPLVFSSARVEGLSVKGLKAVLIRDEDGRANWEGRKDQDDDGGGLRLDSLTISDSTVQFKDAKRRLDITAALEASGDKGLTINGRGQFDGAPATLAITGGRFAGVDPDAAWPFTLKLASTPLDLSADGTMAGVLNTSAMTLSMAARAVSLKKLDYVIEAGLFGTQDIDLTASVRHKNKDWFVDQLDGTMGRSKLSAKAEILKRDGRTKIDATITSSQFDFNDLADDEGQALARAKRARLGPRVIPDTRIDLSKMGPTDGILRFTIAKLLMDGSDTFRSFKGEITLDHKVVRLDKAVVGLNKGELTGWFNVDSTQPEPLMTMEMRLKDATLDRLIGSPDIISGPASGLIRMRGTGSTIREAFASGNGKVSFVAGSGSVNRVGAFALGQDLGGTLVQAVRDRSAMVPLRCAVFSFTAKNGVLTTNPMLMETAVSVGRGIGTINLNGETMAIRLSGASKSKAAVELVDPVRVTGTMSAPVISINNQPVHGTPSRGSILKTVTRSVGSALGLRKNDTPERGAPAPTPINCQQLTSAALS